MTTTARTPVAHRVALAQLEGTETAAVALADQPADQAAVDAAVDAGARWSDDGYGFTLAIPGAMETIAIAYPDSLTVDFGSAIDQFRA